MTYDTCVRDAHIITSNGMVNKNIIINDEKIVDITSKEPDCVSSFSANGLVAIPGIIDPHVHYGVYSPINAAARTESRAAAIGGVTTMMRMLRLHDPFSVSLQEQLVASRDNHYIDYALHASIFTKQQISEMDQCVKSGIKSFKLYMNLGGEIGHVYMDMPPYTKELVSAQVNVTDDIVQETIKSAAALKCPVLVHAEDYESCGCGIKTAKEKRLDGLAAWSNSRLPEYEAKAIKTVCEFGRKYNCAIYFVHIGSTRALEQISRERKLGTRVFVETCPHYLTLSYEQQDGYLAKVMPPIRTHNDQTAVWNALKSDIIDTIGTDHVANQLDLKLAGDNIWSALAGFPGVGTSLPLLLHYGINKNRLTLEQLVRVTSSNTAKIFGMYPKKGTLHRGSDADITFIDLKRKEKVSNDLFGGFSDYSVYEGLELKGWPVHTLCRGTIITDDLTLVGKPGYGKLVERIIP